VHATLDERKLLASSGTHVAHCPSSNLKLASGVAPIPEMVREGISVALGADGAPCNNNLDALTELRLCALVHKPRVGADGWSALQALELATLGGARALGLEDRIGSIEIGKRADLIAIDVRAPHIAPASDPVSALVYAARGSDVRHVLVDGRVLVENRALTSLTGLDRDQVVARAEEHATRINE
jgi:cytosine/adenosine deaminase-related metal-dependent hydrolase